MLTKRQKEVLDFVSGYKERKAYAPSLEEIKRHLKLSSVSTAHYHVRKLKESGYLVKQERHARGLDICKNPVISGSAKKEKSSFSAPIYGIANAGAATFFAEENLVGYVKIPNVLHIKKNTLFAVQVRGDSMNQAKIGGRNLEDGDFALIDPEYQSPKNGDYVLSIINNFANLKKFQTERKSGAIKLVSESTNTNHKPIYISSEDDYIVNGRIVAVIKK